MGDASQDSAIHDAATKYQLSRRGAQNCESAGPLDMLSKLLSNPWTPENPDGLVNLGIAENSLMHKEVAEFVEKNVKIEPIKHLTYGSGPRGSPRLRNALTAFLNAKFRSHEPVRPEDMIILPGVGSAVDVVTWSICDEGEGILVPQPLYNGFELDVNLRARGVLVPAPFHPLEGYRGLHDLFDPEMNWKAFQGALENAKAKGTKIKGVIIAHPHNPLGRCYPAATLKRIVQFCAKHKLHLISDEIYALSVFENPKATKPVPFTSILELDLSGLIDPQLVHMVYGPSKDFCANGFRMGMLYSRNEGLLKAVSTLSTLAWPSYAMQDVWAGMLENQDFLNSFMTTNRKRLAEQYALASGFLDRNKIPYSGNSYAGVFIWMDLRRFFSQKKGGKIPTLAVKDMSDVEVNKYKEREMQIITQCVENGVFIAAGTNYFTEELGWFRLTFTLSREPLMVGLKRFWKSLEEIENKEWQ